jgi:hypothetical protein
LRKRIRPEMEQISPGIVVRGVVFTLLCGCQIVGGGQFQHLRYILLLTLDVFFCLRSLRTFTLKINLNF